jgi:hypothetical protein
MVASVFRLLFGVHKGGGEEDDELTKVWVLPLTPGSSQESKDEGSQSSHDEL